MYLIVYCHQIEVNLLRSWKLSSHFCHVWCGTIIYLSIPFQHFDLRSIMCPRYILRSVDVDGCCSLGWTGRAPWNNGLHSVNPHRPWTLSQIHLLNVHALKESSNTSCVTDPREKIRQLFLQALLHWERYWQWQIIRYRWLSLTFICELLWERHWQSSEATLDGLAYTWHCKGELFLASFPGHLERYKCPGLWSHARMYNAAINTGHAVSGIVMRVSFGRSCLGTSVQMTQSQGCWFLYLVGFKGWEKWSVQLL